MYHNVAGIRAPDGGRWGIGAVHKVLTRTDLRGPSPLQRQFWKTRDADIRR
jgi:site-specific DNA recombinase